MTSTLADTLIAAAQRRATIPDAAAGDALRLVHGSGDGVEGLVVERFGDVLTAQVHQGRTSLDHQHLAAALELLRRHLSCRAVYRKVFVADRAAVPEEVAALHRDPQPWLGEPVAEEIVVHEHGLQFAVRPYDGFSVGLFLEHRGTRRLIRELAAGRRVLNTFAYTCSFSVAAVAGGAAGVHSVDLSPRYLDWGRRNFALNSLPVEGHLFFKSDVLEFYTRARRQGRRYDMIIVDPPTFARLRRPAGTFVLDDRLKDLVSGAIGLLDPGGMLLLSTNARHISAERLAGPIHDAAPRARVEHRPRPADFPGDAEYSKTLLARLPE